MTNASSPIRVLLVDDHFVAVMGIRMLLAEQGGFEVVGDAASGLAGVKLYAELRPDLVLVDMKMDNFDGASTASAIRRTDPNARILMFSSYDAEMDVARARAAGVLGYVFKEAGPVALLKAMEAVARGEESFPHGNELGARATVEGAAPINARDLQLLRLLCLGCSNKEIAEHTGLQLTTIKDYLNELMTKMGVSNRNEASFEAVRRGLVRLPHKKP
ncbi:MAG: response regulator transcription factor [Deltaproteobacteria bacterium]|nr:response regulator transcription factor [Deltaproteobacteria bacterium]